MSGGGGGIERPTGGGGSDCAQLHVQTTLNSVDQSVVALLKKDDVLSVQAKAKRGPLLAVTAGGSVAGSITSASLARLLDCIEKGFEYVAVVQSVKAGEVVVVVRPK
jgi:hypothetical protein